jgi:FdrA protein
VNAVFAVTIHPDTYLDSVVQMMGTRAMEECDGVVWAAAAMASAGNLEQLQAEGFDPVHWNGASPGDLLLAVKCDTDSTAEQAIAAAEAVMFAERASRVEALGIAPRSIAAAMRVQPDSAIAIISIPGGYAALEAHKALAAGLDVLLFSDNVSREDEIALKEHARIRDRFLMGPGAGTAMLSDIGLAFANVVRSGPVGVMAAAGTGAQEAMALLDRWGVGVTAVVGLGGRDLNSDIGGRMASMALEVFDADPATEVILMVSKPPAPDVARALLGVTRGTPVVAALMGVDADLEVADGITVVDTLEGGVLATLDVLGHRAPDTTVTHGPRIEDVIGRLGSERKTIHGLYSGGTLCYEALVLLGRFFGPVYSNTPIDKSLGLPAPQGASILLDLGEEEYTKGRPHPMIDPEARLELLAQSGADPSVAAILMDVVLGHGSHPDPAGVLAPLCREIMSSGGPQVVTYVLGTDADPQHYLTQVAVLVEAGCIVTETAAHAALVAAAIAKRDPQLASLVL